MAESIIAARLRRRPYVDPAPHARLKTLDQIEGDHPALKGRTRTWVYKADAGHPQYVGLRRAIVRIGRSLFLDEVAFDDWISQHAAMPPAPSRASRKTPHDRA